MKVIECSLRDQKEYGKMMPDWNSKKTKKGRYHGSYFAVEGFGYSCWAIGVYINVSHSKYIEEGMTDEQVLEGCVEYLNQPPPRKKYQRRKSVPLYGKLKPGQFRLRQDDSGEYIEAILFTDQRKNKLLWGSGQTEFKQLKKRGRPRKERTND